MTVVLVVLQAVQFMFPAMSLYSPLLHFIQVSLAPPGKYPDKHSGKKKHNVFALKNVFLFDLHAHCTLGPAGEYPAKKSKKITLKYN